MAADTVGGRPSGIHHSQPPARPTVPGSQPVTRSAERIRKDGWSWSPSARSGVPHRRGPGREPGSGRGGRRGRPLEPGAAEQDEGHGTADPDARAPARAEERDREPAGERVARPDRRGAAGPGGRDRPRGHGPGRAGGLVLRADRDLFGLLPSPIDGLKLGAYGEVKLGSRRNPDHNGQWQSGFDAARLVLLPTFQFTDSIIFNAEIEFEHAGSGFDEDDKLHGTAEVEQLYIDFKASPFFNIRSPGIDLVPVGYINQHHEPTLFYSVNRPELADRLIPTTWAVPSTGIYGKIVDGLSYQLQVSSSLEDFGSGFDARTDGKARPRSRPATRRASAARTGSSSRGPRGETSAS